MSESVNVSMAEQNVFNVKVDRMGGVQCTNVATIMTANLSFSKKRKYCSLCYDMHGGKARVEAGKARVIISSKTQNLGQCEAHPQ